MLRFLHHTSAGTYRARSPKIFCEARRSALSGLHSRYADFQPPTARRGLSRALPLGPRLVVRELAAPR
eukprot:6441582-Prymnesium_polylepis.1